VRVKKGDPVAERAVLLEFAPSTGNAESGGGTSQSTKSAQAHVDLDTYTRPELDALSARRQLLDDQFREAKIASKRHALGRRSAMENVKVQCTFVN
jgi:hypothetical protein